MGRIRGKRNRDSDRYWHERRKQTQAGMTATAIEASALCAKCGDLTLREQTHKGWCLPCVSAWVDTVDPWLIYQAQGQLPANVVPMSLAKRIEMLRERIASPAKDEEFLPLTQFQGSRGVGHQRSLWNFLQALYTMEVETTAEAYKLGVTCPNTTHLCGRHAPVQRMSLQCFLSRINSTAGEFKLWREDRRFVDYMRGFIDDNGLFLWTLNKTSIDVYAREKTRKFDAKFGKTHFDKHQPQYWPFEGERDGKLRDEGKLEELPDFVMQIGALLPTSSLPATLREDLCQDLVVAVLTGETTVEDLKAEAVMKTYIRAAFKHHPLKYGRYALDRPGNVAMFGGGEELEGHLDWVTRVSPHQERTYIENIVVDPAEHPHGWHDGRERPKGLASLGDVARLHGDGHAIQGPNVIHVNDEMDEEIREVYEAEQNPRWRQRLSD